MGNIGSGCFGFRRGRRKKLVEFELVDALGAVLPRIRSELSSDLEDSDNLVPGSGSGGCWTAPLLEGAFDDFGRFGSSILIDILPFEETPGRKDFRLSFLLSPWVEGRCCGCCCCWCC